MKLSESTKYNRTRLLSQYLIRSKGVLHLGASTGQEAEQYAEVGRPVLWVEAIPSIHQILKSNIHHYTNQSALCALLSSVDGKQYQFNISNNDAVSSSIFDFGDYAVGKNSLWPNHGLAMDGAITLSSTKLDSLLESNSFSAKGFNHWVLDLQGSELLALQGGLVSLEHCSSLYIEVSKVEVYKGAPLWPELHLWLNRKGFTPLWEPCLDHDNVLFVRDNCLQAPLKSFHNSHYLRHNSRRLEHLASLQVPLHNLSILELGAGIGDHTEFYLDRGCNVTVTDARPENVILLNKRFKNNSMVCIKQFDVDNFSLCNERYDVIHCYGLLYHVSQPAELIQKCSQVADRLYLETCVSYSSDNENQVREPSEEFSQSYSGTGCRPGRRWLWKVLKDNFNYTYCTTTQPSHEEFPLSWGQEGNTKLLSRVVFIGSHVPISSPFLSTSLLSVQEVHTVIT